MGKEKIATSGLRVAWNQFKKNRIAFVALFVLGAFFLIGLYAPILSSSKPLLVRWNDSYFFPLFRYLFYRGFYTKPIDLFYNILMFTLPIGVAGFLLFRGRVRKIFLWAICIVQIGLFVFLMGGAIKDPAHDTGLLKRRFASLKQETNYREDPLLAPFAPYPNWNFELRYMTPYAKLNTLLRYNQRRAQAKQFAPFEEAFYAEKGRVMPTLWNVDARNEREKTNRIVSTLKRTEVEYQNALDKLPELMADYRPHSHAFLIAKYELEAAQKSGDEAQITKAQLAYGDILARATESRLALSAARTLIQQHKDALAERKFLDEKKKWLDKQSGHVEVLIPPLLRPFHWEDDAGGAQSINKYVPWWQITRINRKDLVASLIFGIRVSLVVGVSAVTLSCLLGLFLGSVAGYSGGKTDLVVSRLVEVWEAMPTFFMLLLIVAIVQSKSIFLVVAVLGIFGWTGIARFIRAEFLKQRNLPYVVACHSLGYNHGKIIFSHILPNAIFPILTLLPFSMMAAITSEAGLSFLGLGEEGSTSWGVLMAEGRSAFPAESYLLWPPAILLTILLISIALVGDGLRDAIDPKMRS